MVENFHHFGPLRGLFCLAKPVSAGSLSSHHFWLQLLRRKQPISYSGTSLFPSQWQSDIMQVIDDWNSIPGFRVDLIFASAPSANITFSTESLGVAYGQGEFPTGGNSGYRVRVDPSVPSNLRRLVFVHELGYCLGFRHTNLYSNGEGARSVGGVIITGTPQDDPNSVMNPGSAPNQANG